MTGELIGRLLMVLTGFALMMLGSNNFLHAGEHATLGTLISFSGFVSMLGDYPMPNKHFCQGPTCHTRTTSDRFLKSRGVVRGRYASLDMSYNTERNGYYDCRRNKFFCSQGCEHAWLNEHMENIEQGRPIEFIRHRRESQGYEKVTEESDWGRNYTYIKRVDNRTELD